MSGKKKKKPLEVAKSLDGWFHDGRIVPFTELSDEHLQNALIRSEKKELYFHNRASHFGQLAEKLTEEAERRGLNLNHHHAEYSQKSHANRSHKANG